MVEQILFYVFIIISIVNTMHFGIYLVGANFYDIARFKSGAVKGARVKTRKPLVSVLIPAHNEENSIIRSIKSVRKSSYRKIEIIVIDDASTDNTRKLVRNYVKKHPKSKVKLMFKRKNVGKASAMNHALRHGAKGEIVMTLDADSSIHKDTIKNAVKYFDNSDVVGVAANVRVVDANSSVLGLLQKFEYLIGYRSKKTYSITNCEYIIGGVASTYRMSAIKQVGFFDHDIITEDIALSLKIVSQGNRANRVVYGVDVLAMTEGVHNFKSLFRQRYRWKMGSLQSIIKYRSLFANRSSLYSRMLTWYRIPMAFIGEILILLEPLAIGFVVYYCVISSSTSLLVGAYIFISIYLAWNILPDEHMTWSDKARMIAYIPVMYFIMYIMNAVQLVAMVRCIINYKKVFRLVKTSSVWKSPDRQRQPA